MNVESYNFTDDFQDMILACLITHPEQFFGFGQVIQPGFFNGPIAVEVVHRVVEFYTKYGKYPNFSVLGNLAFQHAARLDKLHAESVLKYVNQLANVDTSDWKPVLDLCIDFAKERAVFEGLKVIHEHQTAGKMDKINAVEMMEKALALGTNYNDMGWSLYHDYDKAIDKATERNYGIHTGFAHLDAIWKFGLAPGWLVVPLAPPKRYKSAFCINLAMNMSGHGGGDVLYYACEISQELAMMRAIYNMSGYTQEQIWDAPEKYKQKVAAALKMKMFNNVWFKGFASKSVTIGEIKSHAKQVMSIHGLKPKAIIVDYAETVKPMAVRKDTPDWRQQADIYVQARAMACELECCVIMPDRCNKDTVDQKVPSMKSFQGSFEKAGVVDIAIGLCSTPEEHLHNRIRYFVFLNRHGPDSQHFEGKVDPKLMRMTIDKVIEYNPEDSEKENQKYRRNIKSRASKDYEAAQAD